MATSICVILGFVGSILSLSFSVSSIASSKWLTIRHPFLKNNIGLMRHCDVMDGEGITCGDMDKLEDVVVDSYKAWFTSVQSIYLLHCVGSLISLCLYILYVFRFLESKGSFKVVTAFNFITLACGIYSVAVFGSHYKTFFDFHNKEDGYKWDEIVAFGYAFYTAITGCCITFLVMIISGVEAFHAGVVIQNMRSRITVWSTPYSLFVQQQEP